MGSSRPVFGQAAPKGRQSTNKGKSYKVAAEQESFSYWEPLPALTKEFTMQPNEIADYFVRAYPDQAGPMAFVILFCRRTYGEQYDLNTYGSEAKALIQRYEADRDKARRLKTQAPSLPRPRWVPLSTKDVARMICQTESGATKCLKFLEDAGVLVSTRAEGKVWYALDYGKMRELKAKEMPKKTAPKADESNIPTDLQQATCADGEACLRNLVRPLFPEGQLPDDSQLVEAIRAAVEKFAIQGKFSRPGDGSCSGLVQISGKDKFARQGKFSPESLTLKPGEGSANIEIPAGVDAVKLANDNGHLSCYALDVQGGVLVIKATPPPSRDNAAVARWRKHVSGITRMFWNSQAGSAEVAEIAGPCEAAGAAPDDWYPWMLDKCQRKAKRNGGRMPAELPPSVLAKITREDFLSYWLAGEQAERDLRGSGEPARKRRWEDEGMWSADKHHWDELSAENQAFYRMMFPDECPEPSPRV